MKMVTQWMDVAKRALDLGDEVHYTYHASDFDLHSGYIVLSTKKFIFVIERGVFRKTYELALEVIYDEIDRVIRNNDMMTLVKGEKRHVLRSGHAQAIEQSMKHLTGSTITV